MKLLSRDVFAALAISLSTVAAAHATDRAIIVLDASGSMWGQIDGRPKLEIARETLRTVLQSTPGDMELGLMAYGHREKGSCTDIELIVPPAAGTASAISQAVDTMNFRGSTPLTAAVRQAAEALRYTEDKATVVLITDGVETCEADPCALGRELEEAGVDFTAHVVGFGLTADEGREVACLAENTGGRYLQASDAAGLGEALAAAVTAEAEPEPEPEPEPEAVEEPTPAAPAESEINFAPEAVMTAGGEPLKDAGVAWEIFKADAAGSAGEHVATEYDNYRGTLEPGDYVVRVRLGEARVEQKLTVEAGMVQAPVFVLNAGTLIVRPRAAEGEEVSSDATVLIDYPGGDGPLTTYGENTIVLPAGELRLTARLGSGEASETLELPAGETIEKDIVIGVGHVVVDALYAPGGDKVDSPDLSVTIFKAKLNIDGTREEITHNYGSDMRYALAPGDHVAVVKLDQAEVEQPFNIRAGEAKGVTATLNAGVLAITAPGAQHISVFAAKKDIQGNREEFGHGFDGAHQTTLPAGDYVIVTDRGDGSPVKETPTTIKAGERTELTIE